MKMLSTLTIAILLSTAIGCGDGPVIKTQPEPDVVSGDVLKPGEILPGELSLCEMPADIDLTDKAVKTVKVTFRKVVGLVEQLDCDGNVVATTEEITQKPFGKVKLKFDNLEYFKTSGARYIVNYDTCDEAIVDSPFLSALRQDITLKGSTMDVEDSLKLVEGDNILQYKVYSSACDLESLEAEDSEACSDKEVLETVTAKVIVSIDTRTNATRQNPAKNCD